MTSVPTRWISLFQKKPELLERKKIIEGIKQDSWKFQQETRPSKGENLTAWNRSFKLIESEKKKKMNKDFTMLLHNNDYAYESLVFPREK